MPSVVESIEINAPVHRVFDLVAHQLDRLPQWWRPFERVQNVTPPPTRVGTVSRYIYNLLGIRIKGEYLVRELVENRRLCVQTTGLDSWFEFSFSGDDYRTRLVVRMDYKLPGEILSKLLTQAALEKRHLEDMVMSLSNLRDIAESESAVA